MRRVEADASTRSGPESGSYSEFIRPEHPLVDEMVVGLGAGTRESHLVTVITRIGEKLRYRPVPGRRSLDALAAGFKEYPTQAQEANCLTICCCLASALRRIGFTEDEVFVALASTRTVGHFHAWLMVSGQEELYWIDPAHLALHRLQGAEIDKLHHMHVLFNDRRLLVNRSDKETLLKRGRLPRPRLVIFGRHDHVLERVLRTDRLRDLLTALLYSPGPILEPWQDDEVGLLEAEGILTRVDDRLIAGPRLVVIPAQPLEDLRDEAWPSVTRFVELVGEAVPELRERFLATVAARYFTWQEVEHALLVGALMDLAVGHELAGQGEGLDQRVEAVIWAFGGGAVANAVGVQRTSDPETGWTIAQLWHGGFERESLALSPLAVRALAGRLDGAADDLDPGLRLFLEYRGLTRNDGPGNFTSAVPGFLVEEWRGLSEALDRAASLVVSEAVSPLVEWARSNSWWAPRMGQREARHAVFRVLLEQAVDVAVETGEISPFPTSLKLKSNWGRWLYPGAKR